MRHFSALVLALLGGVVLAGSAHAATVYDPTADFSIASNPNGVWTYGYYNNAATSFKPYVLATDADPNWHGNANLDAWSQHLYDSNSYSVVGKNVSGTLQNERDGGSIAVDPGTLFFHPGLNGEKPTIRFTAPGNGTIDYSATFSADDTGGGDRDVHVYKNGTSLFDGAVVGTKGAATPATSSISNLAVNAGDKIDFAVGFGSGGYGNDATGFSGSVSFTAVPEPSVALVGIGIAGASMLRRRRLNAE